MLKALSSPIIAVSSLTFASLIEWNMGLGANGTNVSVTLTGNATMDLPTNIIPGSSITLTVIQDATGGRTLAFNGAFVFPNGQPILNTIPGAEDIFTFYAISSNSLILTNYNSSVPNWDNYDGAHNCAPQYLNAVGSAALQKVIVLSSTRLVLLEYAASIIGYVVTINSRGQITNVGASQTLMASITNGVYGSASVISPTQFVLGYKKTVGAANANVLGCSVSGTTITPGTAVQIRSAEVCSGGVEVAVLDSGNFAACFRTSTADILYVYQCTIDGSNNIVAANDAQELTIETGNAATFDAKFTFKDSTHLWLTYRSTVTATTARLFTIALTFSGIGNTPTAGAALQVATIVQQNAGGGAAIYAVLMSSATFTIFWLDTSNNPHLVLITDSSGTLSAGTPTIYVEAATVATSNCIMLDANHVCATIVDNTSNQAIWVFTLNNGVFNSQIKATLLSQSAWNPSDTPGLCLVQPGMVGVFAVATSGSNIFVSVVKT